MAIKDGKKIILTDAAEEVKSAAAHKTIKDASSEMFADMPSVINETLRRGKQAHKGDFFIEILIRFKKFAGNAVHPYLNVTRTCPNPKYKQTVFHYEKNSDNLKLLWVLPDQFHASFYTLDPLRFPSDNVKYLFDHNDGKLQKIADDINKNIKD